jgi:FAD/FMN-containing dehydrogenase
VIGRLRRSLGARILLLAALNVALLIAITLAASGIRVPRSLTQVVMQSAESRLQDVARRIALDLERTPAADADALLEELGTSLSVLGGLVVESAVADDAAGRDRLWRWREAHSEAAAALGVVHKADVTVPLSAMAAFVDGVPARVDDVAPGATTLVYGHLGDGNVHVNVVGPGPEDDRAIDVVLELVLEHGGSVSAEHGIGVAKRAWLERQRGSAAVAAMRAIKQALDPDGILNPAVLLPPEPP